MAQPQDAEGQPFAQQLSEQLVSLLGQREWQVDEIPLALSAEESFPEETLPMAEPTTPELLEPEPEQEVFIPSARQLLEAMLFVGGKTLTAEQACQLIRGLQPADFHAILSELNCSYRLQNRPYIIVSSASGYQLVLRSRYHGVKERLFGGPRQTHLTQSALDVLALIAYRQPISKSEIDSQRGQDSGPILRSLVRLHLISIGQRGSTKDREVTYSTTMRFLEIFGLRNLADLPQLEESERL